MLRALCRLERPLAAELARIPTTVARNVPRLPQSLPQFDAMWILRV